MADRISALLEELLTNVAGIEENKQAEEAEEAEQDGDEVGLVMIFFEFIQ